MTSPECSCGGMAALTTHSVSRCFCRHLVCSVPVLRGRPVQCAYTLTHTLVLPLLPSLHHPSLNRPAWAGG